MGQKIGESSLPPLWGGGLGPHLTQSRLGRGLYLHTKWHLNPSSHLATTADMDRKLGAGCVFFEGRELDSRLTQCGQGRGLPACQVSS